MRVSSSLTAVAVAALIGPAAATTYFVDDYDGYMAGAYGTSPNVTFKSTSVTQPLFQASWDQSSSALPGGYIIMTPSVSGQGGVFVINGSDLSLVWALVMPSGGGNANIWELEGEQVLSTFSQSPGATSAADDYIYDSTLERIHTFSTINSTVKADGHELYLTGQGTAIMPAYEPKTWDLSSIGGDVDDTLADSCFEEVDFIANVSIFHWCASDWINVNETVSGGGGGGGGFPGNGTFPPGGDFPGNGTDPDFPGGGGPGGGAGGTDVYHINSIQKVTGGNYLVSFRFLSAVLLISGSTGEPIWQLGGYGNDFTDISDGQAITFALQHHAVAHDDALSRLTLFDNNQGRGATVGCVANCSRGLELELDTDAMTARLVHADYHPKGVSSGSMGSNCLLPNGNRLVGYGSVATVTEHDVNGNVVAEIEWALIAGSGGGGGGGGMGGASYRVFWAPADSWVTSPTSSPDLVVEDGVAYVSWNGATQVAQWVLVDQHDETVIAAPRDGFETAIDVSAFDLESVSAQALDANGSVLGISAVFSL